MANPEDDSRESPDMDPLADDFLSPGPLDEEKAASGEPDEPSPAEAVPASDDELAPLDDDRSPPDPLAETTEFGEPAEALPAEDDELPPLAGDTLDTDLGSEPDDALLTDAAEALPAEEEAEEEVLKEGEPEEQEKEEKPSFLEKLADASPYTVMLGISLAAVVIAVVCLLLELREYDFDIKAEGAKQRVMWTPEPFQQPINVRGSGDFFG